MFLNLLTCILHYFCFYVSYKNHTIDNSLSQIVHTHHVFESQVNILLIYLDECCVVSKPKHDIIETVYSTKQDDKSNDLLK